MFNYYISNEKNDSSFGCNLSGWTFILCRLGDYNESTQDSNLLLIQGVAKFLD